MGRNGWLSVLVVIFSTMAVPYCQAYIREDEFQTLQWFMKALVNRSSNWVEALHTWECPTDPANSDSICDPCGRKEDGNWDHVNCRGPSNGTGESGRGIIDGYVTTMHITDYNLNGPPPKEVCNFKFLRELDLDGGRATGPLPEWAATCLPSLQELDLSFNLFTGTIPEAYADVPFLQEIKLEQNQIIGSIPASLGRMRTIRRLRLHDNLMTGTLPESLRNTSEVLWDIQINNNDFEGDLSVLSDHHLAQVTTSGNPKLCGMVPASVRYARGFNPAGTGLGRPC